MTEQEARRVMSETTVVHVKDPGGYDVYIGRAMPRQRLKASPFANPFKIGKDCTREQAIRRYAIYLMGRPDLLALAPELRGKRLGCWCKPEACHGDILVDFLETHDARTK